MSDKDESGIRRASNYEDMCALQRLGSQRAARVLYLVCLLLYWAVYSVRTCVIFCS